LTLTQATIIFLLLTQAKRLGTLAALNFVGPRMHELATRTPRSLRVVKATPRTAFTSGK
jgi:hypothetical protein